MDFSRIDELTHKLEAMRPLNETELKRLRDEFMIENTYHSNAIEGSTLTLRETAMILQDGITIAEKPIKEHLEAIGHRDAFEYVISLADAKTARYQRHPFPGAHARRRQQRHIQRHRRHHHGSRPHTTAALPRPRPNGAAPRGL